MPGALLAWFDDHQRPMPWRETRDPYHIWISEVMLQQTQVATVIPYFERFTARFPTVGDLAAAPLDDVLKHWEGLGYYSRARNLQKAAQQIVTEHGSVFPDDYAAIRALPGVGDYTAGAVASIAFNLPEPAVDGNVFRVLARLFLIADDIAQPRSRRRFEAVARELIPPGEAWRFNQALMELGATVCTAANPRCGECPVAAWCQARATERVRELPVKSKKTVVKEVEFLVGVVRDAEGRYLITRRPAKGLLGGLWEFPTVEAAGPAEAAALVAWWRAAFGAEIAAATKLLSVPHLFTHRKALFHAFTAELALGAPVPASREDQRWVAPDELDGFAFPLAHNKIRQALGRPEQLGLNW